ncbi:MAG: extracellular solute-binding protein [Oscillospiraceae bacterium]|jgi:lactose/L-arabinose transport system substrate-binding protein|nr:extracellular solute-binding protein [Oscillospiraceae bacterium]
MLTASASGGTASLTVWCWDPAFNLYAMKEAAKVYQQDHPDFTLDVVEVGWDDIQTRINTAAAAGDLSTLPDILLCQNNAFQKNTISYPDLFLDLTDSGIDFSKFGAGSVGYSVVDGKNWGVPFDNGAAVNVLRTDILEEAGYTMTDLTDITWDRYIEIGKDVLAKTGHPLLSSTAGGGDLLAIMLQSAGSSMFTDDGQPNIAGNAVLRAAIDAYLTLVREGVMVEVNNWDEYIASFITGNVAGTINGCWILASVQTATDQSGKWAVTNLPKLSVEGATNYSANGGSSWGITSGSKNPDLAKDFLAATFAGSVPFYETILPSSGALANYMPAAESAVYTQPQAFFGDQAIYALIVEFSGKVPANAPGVYYYEARDALASAITNINQGGNIDTELQAAQDEVAFTMGQ